MLSVILKGGNMSASTISKTVPRKNKHSSGWRTGGQAGKGPTTYTPRRWWWSVAWGSLLKQPSSYYIFNKVSTAHN